MDDASIKFSEACRIAGMKDSTIRSWRSRARAGAANPGDNEILNSEYFKPRDRRVDREGLQFLCIFAQLSGMGLTVRNAFEAALTYFVGDPIASPSREPGEPFEEGRTLMALSRRWDGQGFDTRILNVLPGQTVLDTIFEHPAPGQAPVGTALLVDLNAIEARVEVAFAAFGASPPAADI